MRKKNNLSYWEDVLGCILVLILFCSNYSLLIKESGVRSRGQSLTYILILLNKYFEEIGVYVFLGILFLWFFIRAICKLLKNNKNEYRISKKGT